VTLWFRSISLTQAWLPRQSKSNYQDVAVSLFLNSFRVVIAMGQ
jgi:hypothetical protein